MEKKSIVTILFYITQARVASSARVPFLIIMMEAMMVMMTMMMVMMTMMMVMTMVVKIKITQVRMAARFLHPLLHYQLAGQSQLVLNINFKIFST